MVPIQSLCFLLPNFSSHDKLGFVNSQPPTRSAAAHQLPATSCLTERSLQTHANNLLCFDKLCFEVFCSGDRNKDELFENEGTGCALLPCTCLHGTLIPAACCTNLLPVCSLLPSSLPSLLFRNRYVVMCGDRPKTQRQPRLFRGG
jgi:hypothetical protein